jgi:DNA polymerase-3 subunit delta'
MGWNSVLNQARVKEFLRVSLERGRLAHAYLFSGPPGAGKYAAALELAKTVNCEKKGVEACDVCRSCRMAADLQHPDLNLVMALPVGASERHGDPPLAKLGDEDLSLLNEQLRMKAANPYHRISLPRANAIKINSIREIRRESSLTRFGAGKKVFIVLEADAMTDEAANALLKTLEEPHPETLLILTSPRPDALPATIRSRCQQLKFELLSDDVISQALREREGLERAQSSTLARLASGSYTSALAYLGAGMGEVRAEAVEFLRTMLYKTRRNLISEIDRLAGEYEKDSLKEILRLIEFWLRDAMRAREGIGAAGPGGGEDAETLRKFLLRYTRMDYVRASEALERAISLLDKNVYIPLVLIELTRSLKGAIDPM